MNKQQPKFYKTVSGVRRNLVFELPHAGNNIPESFRCHPHLVEAAHHRLDNNTDYAGDYLLKRCGGDLIQSNVSRIVVDLNRGANRIDDRVCPTWPGARRHDDGGVIVASVPHEGSRMALYTQALSDDEVQQRLETCWYPYHDRLQSLVDHSINRFGSVVLISLHSVHPDKRFQKGDQPVLFVGSNNGQSCSLPLLHQLVSHMEKHQFHVLSEDHPYQGAFTTQAYGVERSVESIQLELDRRFLDPGEESNPMLDALADALCSVTRKGVSASNARASSHRMASRGSYYDPLTGDVYF